MNREVHVRFSEGLAVRFRGATQLLARNQPDDFPSWRSRTGKVQTNCYWKHAPLRRTFPSTVQHPSRKRLNSFMCSLTEDVSRPPGFANPTASPNG